jgi:hypothetical protein
MVTPASAAAATTAFGDVHHGMAEDLVALHAQVAGLAVGGDAAVNVEQVLLGPVGAQRKAQQAPVGDGAFALPRLQHDRAGAVAEQDAGAAVGPVHQPGHGLRADDERAFGAVAGDEPVGDRQRIDEAGADGLDVEGDADGAPSLRWTIVAVAGKVRSAVVVATTIRSTSSGVRPAAASAFLAASTARSETGPSC